MSLLIAGCTFPGKPNPAYKPVAPNEVNDFSLLYRENCAGCHGADGTLGPAPPLNDPLFLSIVPDTVLLKVITEGRAGTLMPAFAQEKAGSLTAAQVQIVAAGLKKKWGLSEKPGLQPPPYETTADGDPKRGEKAFARACASCHGATGEGASPETKINDPVFLALTSNQALRRYAITGRPDFGMPDFAGKRDDDSDFKPLSAIEVTDLVAYMASWRKGGPKKKP